MYESVTIPEVLLIFNVPKIYTLWKKREIHSWKKKHLSIGNAEYLFLPT